MIDLKEFVESGVLYFCKYGRGAVLVALENNDEQLKAAANNFHQRDDITALYGSLYPVKDLRVEGETVVFDFEFGNALVTRMLPISQVTFEVFNKK